LLAISAAVASGWILSAGKKEVLAKGNLLRKEEVGEFLEDEVDARVDLEHAEGFDSKRQADNE
jgi:hypothetical protein